MDRKNRETEEFLQNLYSEITILNKKARSNGLIEAREKLLADMALENNKMKEQLLSMQSKFE